MTYLGQQVVHRKVSIFKAIETQNDVAFLESLRFKELAVSLVNKKGNTALIETVIKGKYQYFLHLLEAKADINAVGENGTTALIEAVKRDRKDFVEKLCSQKMLNKKHKDSNGKSALDYATEHKLWHIRNVVMGRHT